MRVGDQLTLKIEKPAAGGRMIARHDGAVVLVAGAIPGEVVTTRVERVQRHTAWAATTQVVDASPDRLGLEGDGSCGGCVFAHVRYARQLALKREIIFDALKRIGHLEPPEAVEVLASPREGYRMRARLHVQAGRLGFFREGSHTLCDPAETGQLLAETMSAVRSLESALRRITKHEVIEVEVAENVAANERAIHLDLSSDGDVSSLARKISLEGVTGLSCGRVGNHRVLALSGTPFVRDDLSVQGPSGAVVVGIVRHVRSFFQANRFLLAPLVGSVNEMVPSGHVLDLYAGVGLFAVAIAAAGNREVTAIEGDRSAADDLKRNAAAAAGAVVARQQSVEAFLSAERDSPAAAIIVDPPRTGLSKDALRGLVRWTADRVVYVSCDPATFARDARALVEEGFRLQRLRAFDLFPKTAHVEMVALFERWS
jgi:23S rRNA (uracil1939-C5)-methyltransferase